MLYTFRMVDSGDCCSALNVPAAIEQRSQSSNSDERWHTRVIVTAQRSCICDPVVKTTKEMVRSLKCLYLWKCSTRRIWFQLDEDLTSYKGVFRVKRLRRSFSTATQRCTWSVVSLSLPLNETND
jgi:hypothetical protein